MKYIKTYEKLENLWNMTYKSQYYKSLEGKYLIMSFEHKSGDYMGEKIPFIVKVLSVSFYDFRFYVEIYEYNHDLKGYDTLKFTYYYDDMKQIKIVGEFDNFSDASKEFKMMQTANKYNL